MWLVIGLKRSYVVQNIDDEMGRNLWLKKVGPEINPSQINEYIEIENIQTNKPIS